MSGLVKYRRRQLIRVTPDESFRVGVPKNRTWLIVQSDKVPAYFGKVLCCYLTSEDDEGEKRKPKQDTDARVKKGTKLGEGRVLSKNSLIRCHQLHLITVDNIVEYAGILPEIVMQSVDEKLRRLLQLPAKLDAFDELVLSHRPKKS